jgi:adenosylcobinamide-GDP ribazoletransferase
MRRLLLAFSFLTILPVPFSTTLEEEEIGKSSVFFPLVGLLKGVVLFSASLLLLRFWTADTVAALVLLVHVTLSGAFHLDGLSDTFDALAARADREKKLKIMKDGTVGAVGAVSLVLVLLIKYLLLKEVLSEKLWPVLLLFPLAGTMAMVVVSCLFKAARTEGLGSIFIKGTGPKELFIATSFTIGILVLSIYFSPKIEDIFIPFIASMMVATVEGRLFEKHFHGITGDNIGAVAETSELAFLLFCLI